MIYLDAAATTLEKPPQVRQAMAQAAEQQVMAAQAETNLELARYAKASRFRVVEREIPTVECTFSAEKFLKQYDIETK